MPASRTHLRVRRSDGQEFPTMDAAYRALLGTPSEIDHRFRRGARAQLRAGVQAVRDSYGFSWSLVDAIAAQAITWTDLTFGVEIEMMMPSHWTYAHAATVIREALGGESRWDVHRDGSLQGGNGAEAVSPVLRGLDGIAELTKVMDALQAAGCDVNTSCGMHVHIGVGNFEVRQIANVAASFIANEEHFDSIVARSRRANNSRYAQTVRYQTIATDVRTIASLATQLNGGWNPSVRYSPYRYRKLNLQSYALHRTVEFRQHQGTIESSKAVAWVRLLTGFVAATLNNRSGAMTFEQFVAFSGEHAGFLTERRAHFARREARRAATA